MPRYIFRILCLNQCKYIVKRECYLSRLILSFLKHRGSRKGVQIPFPRQNFAHIQVSSPIFTTNSIPSATNPNASLQLTCDQAEFQHRSHILLHWSLSKIRPDTISHRTLCRRPNFGRVNLNLIGPLTIELSTEVNCLRDSR